MDRADLAPHDGGACIVIAWLGNSMSKEKGVFLKYFW